MNSDAAFTMGRAHTVCEDYALAGERAGSPYAIVCDGCSSAKRTDFGARLLALAARRNIGAMGTNLCADSVIKTPKICDASIIEANEYLQALGLDQESLLATLMVGRVVDDYLESIVVGDGVVMGVRHDGTYRIMEYSFPSGAPFYLAYCMNESWMESWLARFGADMEVTVYDNIDEVMTSLNVSKGVVDERIVKQWPRQTYKTLVMFSDGIRSCMRQIATENSRTTVPVRMLDVIPEFVSFPQYTGQFVQRRFRRAMDKFTEKGWYFADDLSVAAVFAP